MTLPNTIPDESAPPPDSVGDEPSQAFADPSRLSNLAVLYSAIAVERRGPPRLSGPVQRDQIDAHALDASGNGSNYLPIIQLVTKASTAPGAEKLNAATFNALKGLLASRQRANNIIPNGRVKLILLTAPSEPLLLSGPSMTRRCWPSCSACSATIAVVHVLEGLSLRRRSPESEQGFDEPFETEIPDSETRRARRPSAPVAAGRVSSTPVLAAAGGDPSSSASAATRASSPWCSAPRRGHRAGCAATRVQANPMLAAVAGGLVVAAWHRYLLAWPTLLGAVLVVILFIPIRRYTMGAGSAAQLEPYRLVLAAVLMVWVLCAARATRARAGGARGLEAPVIGFLVVVLLSVAFNVGHVNALGSPARS